MIAVLLVYSKLYWVGRNQKNGKRKGGIKAHTVINTDETVPSLMWFSSARVHDHNFLSNLKCDDNTIYVFDKGYNDYKSFKHFGECKKGFVTRIKDNAVYQIVQKTDVPEGIHSGVLSDEIMEDDLKDGKKH